MSERSRTFTVSLALVVLTIVTYVQVKDHEFLPYDDDRYVTENWPVKNGITSSTLLWALTSSHASNWHPLTWYSHMLDIELFGLDSGAHHLVNLFFHILNSILLLFVLSRLTRVFWQSAFVAALFALHPLHVESVAWIAERKDLLSMLFFLLTLWSYVRYVEQPTKLRFAPVAVFFILGLMSKPMLVTLPFVLLLLDYWPLKRFKGEIPSMVGTWERPAPNAWRSHTQLIWALVWEKFWLFALALASSNITYQAQQHGGTVSDVDTTPIFLRIANAITAYTGYLRKTFWPGDLAAFYPYPDTVDLWGVVGSAGVLIVVTLLVLMVGRRWRYLPVGWFWYLGTLVPVIGLVQVGAQSMADRYTYIPLVGIFVMIAWGCSDLFASLRRGKQILTVAAGVVIMFCSVLTWRQAGYWKDGVALFSRALEVTEGNWLAHHNLGWSLHHAGRLEEAREQFMKTLEFYPSLIVAHYNLGRVARDEGRLDEAHQHFKQALEIDPAFELAHVNIGLLHEKEGRILEARAYFDSVLALWPEFERVRFELATLLMQQQEFDAAMEHLEAILEVNPFHLDARQEMDRIQSRMERPR